MESAYNENLELNGLLREVKHAYTGIQLKEAEEIWGTVPEILIRNKGKEKALVSANANLCVIEKEEKIIETHGLVSLEDGSFYSIDYECGKFRAVLISPIIAIQQVLISGNYGLLDELDLILLAMEILGDREKINRGINETASYIW